MIAEALLETPVQDHRSRVVGPEQVARHAGVSPKAVVDFFRRRPGSMAERSAASRILAASRALSFEPLDPAWRVRIHPQQGEFCFVLDSAVGGGFTNEFFARMINGALGRLGQMGRTLTFDRFDASVDYAANPELLPACVRAGSASRFMIAGRPNPTFTSWITRLGFPVVHLSREVPLPGVCSVVPDYAFAARWAICYLASQGHRHIALALAPHFRPGAWNTEELLRGAEEAAVVARLPGQELPVLRAPAVGKDAWAWGQDLFELFCQLKPRPTAVFCFDDSTASELMRAALTAGWVIPRDLSIVGCNNVPSSSRIHPSLTTMHLPVEEMGRVSVEKLEEMSRREVTDGPASPRTITLDVELIVRETTEERVVSTVANGLTSPAVTGIADDSRLLV